MAGDDIWILGIHMTKFAPSTLVRLWPTTVWPPWDLCSSQAVPAFPLFLQAWAEANTASIGLR